MNRVLILGAYGYFGNILCKYLKRKDFIIFRQGRNINADYKCNPNIKNELNNLILKIKPNCIINLIAETDVDKCELNPEIAFRTNCMIVENIISSIKDKNIFLIHISTDQVYSGKGPHHELKVNPINEYSKTKYFSENIAMREDSLVLRTNFVGKSISEKSSFTDWAFSSYLGKKEISLFNDVFFSPVHTSFLSEIITYALKKKYVGVYNLGCATGISKYEFVKEFMSKIGLHNHNMKNISVDDFKFKALRPKDMRLNSKKFEDKFHLKVPSLDETLRLVIMDYKN